MGALRDIAETYEGSYSKTLEQCYIKLSIRCKDSGISAPFAELKDKQPEHYEIALLKLQCADWWYRKLKRYRLHTLEHLEVATGEVGKPTNEKGRDINPYSSRFACREFVAQKRKNKEYIDGMELESEDGTVISLRDAVDASVANPENRRAELMLRVRSIEEHALD